MTNRNLILVLNANHEYIRHTGEDEVKYASQMNSFFESITDTYLPLLKMFETLENDNIQFSLSIVFSPSVCTMLEDSVIQKQYIEWLENHILLGKKEIERCKNNPLLLNNAKLVLEKFQEAKIQFLSYDQKLLKKFREYQKKGVLEILATTGTPVFLPHYSDMEEILNAQVETGLYAYRYFFNEIPDGFWLPELGYAEGIEKVLRSYGMTYTILDSRSFLFSQEEPVNGIFSPCRFENSLVCFSRDFKADRMIFDEDGYCSNSVYRNINHDIGFYLPSENLSPCNFQSNHRCSTGFSYWNKNTEDYDVDDFASENFDAESIYDVEAAFSQCKTDAENFVSRIINRLTKAEEILYAEQNLNIICTIDLESFRKNWNEGIFFLENVFRCGSWQQLNFSQCRRQTENPYQLQKIKPYYGSVNGAGYGEELLSNRNSWMMRYVRKASQRMVDLSERFSSDTGLKSRLLNLGARELLLAQSTGWAKMIQENLNSDYAEYRFKKSISDFTSVFDALGSNTVSTEWLTHLEMEHQIFPWMNYRIFCRKHSDN